MHTRSSSNLHVESPHNPSTSNPKRRNRRRSKQPFILEESPVDTMADQRTMTELLRAPTEGYAEVIVVPSILAEQFELKHSLINMMTSDMFFRLEKNNPHDDIRWFKKIISTIKYKDVPNSAIKLMIFPLSLAGAVCRWLKKEPSRSILTWEDLVSKFINEFFPLSRTINLRNEISNFQQRFDESFHEAWDRYKDLLHSLNSAAGGNLLERRTQDVLTIIENKSKVRNSQNKSVVSQVKSSDANSNSSSKIAKLTHAVNQQTSAVTTAMTTILKQFQATPPPAFVKAVEENCVTCGGAHPYYQCLAVGGNTFSKLRDNIQGYGAAAAINYNKGNSVYRPLGSGSLPNNTVANPKGELKAITTQSGIVLNGPSVLIPPLFINPKKDERVEETLTDHDLAEDLLQPNIPYPSRMYKQKQQEKDDVQIHKFWQMFKQLHINTTLTDALILIPKYQKMLKALISKKEKLQQLENIPLNENCSVVILKKLPEKLGDLRKFLIPCDFNKLKCKALADLANRAICTPAGITRDVFIPVGKFTFPADFIIVDYESDPRVPLILGRPFLRTARALIDVHGKEMILRDGDERLTLNMRHDTTTFFSHPILTSPKVKDDAFNPERGNVLPKKLLDLDSTKDLHPPHHINPLSGRTSSSSSPNHLLEEFVDELALITFPPEYNDDLTSDIESDLKEIEYLLYHYPIKDMDSCLKDLIDQSNLDDLNDNLVDTVPEMFTDEHALDYSSPPLYDEYDDDLFLVKSDNEYVYDDPFDSKGDKIKESKLLIDELDLPSDFLPSLEYDSFLSEDFSEGDALPSTNNKDKVFNPSILIQENCFEVINCVAPDKKLVISHASLILEDFDPPLYELSFFKEVLMSKTLLSFSFENKEKVFKPRIQTSEEVHSSFIPELSHQGYKFFKINQILKCPMKIFLFSYEEDIHILNVPCLHFYPP
uniref:Retrotransposon gag domain-containing protein n=1 Tax=Tanacetum cinerariifolium TaxID=118510 RepID=A0A6L2KBS2_TANCI|nr:hypothetical protein [Tanacetum cinerariifolium]